MWLLAVPGTPYVIVYRVEGETVDILSMLFRQVERPQPVFAVPPTPRCSIGARHWDAAFLRVSSWPWRTGAFRFKAISQL
jgi:hypothetical protein